MMRQPALSGIWASVLEGCAREGSDMIVDSDVKAIVAAAANVVHMIEMAAETNAALVLDDIRGSVNYRELVGRVKAFQTPAPLPEKISGPSASLGMTTREPG